MHTGFLYTGPITAGHTSMITESVRNTSGEEYHHPKYIFVVIVVVVAVLLCVSWPLVSLSMILLGIALGSHRPFEIFTIVH